MTTIERMEDIRPIQVTGTVLLVTEKKQWSLPFYLPKHISIREDLAIVPEPIYCASNVLSAHIKMASSFNTNMVETYTAPTNSK